MKPAKLFLVIFLMLPSVIGFSALVTHPLKLEGPEAKAEIEKYKRTRATSEIWKKGTPPPTTLEEAGLESDATVVAAPFYFDGGTRGYLLKDGRGHYFAFCSGPAYSNDPRKKNEEKKHWFIGALYFSEKEATVVEEDSEAGKFLTILASRVTD